jgi:hypothetical protein
VAGVRVWSTRYAVTYTRAQRQQPQAGQGLLQTMIDGIRVDARDHIEPTFCVPAVRIESGFMEPTGIEPVTSCLQSRRSPS